jgi:RNA polymerase sigma factor (sigma-70 family)
MYMQKSQSEILASYNLHVDTVYRVCRMFFNKSVQDAEDALQTTFLKRIKSSKTFENTEHEKAWLIVVAGNVCRDMLKRSERKNVRLGDMQIPQESAEQSSELIEYVHSLPDKYKTAMYLHYYEDYTCERIAKVMKKSQGTIWNYLHVGRKMMKTMIEGEA